MARAGRGFPLHVITSRHIPVGANVTGVSQADLVFTATTAGTRDTFGVSTVPLVFGATTVGLLDAQGSSTVPLVLTITTAGTSTGTVTVPTRTMLGVGI